MYLQIYQMTSHLILMHLNTETKAQPRPVHYSNTTTSVLIQMPSGAQGRAYSTSNPVPSFKNSHSRPVLDENISAAKSRKTRANDPDVGFGAHDAGTEICRADVQWAVYPLYVSEHKSVHGMPP